MTTPSAMTSEELLERSNEVAFVLELSYSANVDDETEGGSSLVMRALAQPRGDGWPRRDGDWFEMGLRFLGVRDLRVGPLGPGPLQVVGFVIDDWSDRQLEGITYKVGDYEDDRISFFCARVVVESRSALHARPAFL